MDENNPPPTLIEFLEETHLVREEEDFSDTHPKQAANISFLALVVITLIALAFVAMCMPVISMVVPLPPTP